MFEIKVKKNGVETVQYDDYYGRSISLLCCDVMGGPPALGELSLNGNKIVSIDSDGHIMWHKEGKKYHEKCGIPVLTKENRW